MPTIKRRPTHTMEAADARQARRTVQRHQQVRARAIPMVRETRTWNAQHASTFPSRSTYQPGRSSPQLRSLSQTRLKKHTRRRKLSRCASLELLIYRQARRTARSRACSGNHANRRSMYRHRTYYPCYRTSCHRLRGNLSACAWSPAWLCQVLARLFQIFCSMKLLLPLEMNLPQLATSAHRQWLSSSSHSNLVTLHS